MENMHADDRCKRVKRCYSKKKKKRLVSGLLEIVIFIVTSDNQKIFDINGFLGLFN